MSCDLDRLDSAALAALESDSLAPLLADLEPIDLFLARELQRQLAAPPVCFPLWLALHWALRQGHSCLELAAIAGQTLWQDRETGQPGYRFGDEAALQQALAELDLSPGADRPVVQWGGRLYLRRYWCFETELAERLRSRLAPLALTDGEQERARTAMAQLFPQAPLNGEPAGEVDWQAVAVANALPRRFSILSGGPGTGKTYTVTRLLACLQAVAGGQLRILMAAPTGKAKQRLQESITAAKVQLADAGLEPTLLQSIPESAHTLHGLLGVRLNSTELRHHADRPLATDLLLIDEASMVDLPMMTRVLRALPDSARLVLVGDANQLPSIAVGAVLADLAPLPHPGYSDGAAARIAALCGYRVDGGGSGAVDHLELLRKSHRFDGSGGVGQLARGVIGLDVEGSWQLLQHAAAAGNGELGFVPPGDLDPWLEENIAHHYAPLAAATDPAEAFRRLAAFRLLVPTRGGPLGVDALNLRVEEQLARRSAAVRPGHHYHGRPIMVTRNHHGLGVFNGDVGVVWANEQGVLEACFPQETGVRRINLGLLPALEPVYAMTIHKTQGSEFERVALLLGEDAGRLLSPELLYTGITRAKRHCVVSASEPLWRTALAGRAERWSGLRAQLENGLNSSNLESLNRAPR